MARAFVFPLESLFRLRRVREREARRAAATKRAELMAMRRLDIETARQVAAQQQALRNEQLLNQLDPAAAVRRRAWIAHLRRTIVQRQALAVQKQRELEALVAALREARKQTLMLERLREKRYDEWLADRRRREQAATDELARELLAREQREQEDSAPSPQPGD